VEDREDNRKYIGDNLDYRATCTMMAIVFFIVLLFLVIW